MELIDYIELVIFVLFVIYIYGVFLDFKRYRYSVYKDGCSQDYLQFVTSVFSLPKIWFQVHIPYSFSFGENDIAAKRSKIIWASFRVLVVLLIGLHLR
ncbi:MAG: hypothetical protein OCD76_21130 [Reichenbachiella sp.]